MKEQRDIELKIEILKLKAKSAIENGNFSEAEVLFDQIETLDLQNIEQTNLNIKSRLYSMAENYENQALLHGIYLRYDKASEYNKKALECRTKANNL